VHRRRAVRKLELSFLLMSLTFAALALRAALAERDV
jgi:hypothetical protein